MPTEQLLQWIWNIGGPFIPVCIIVWAFYTNRIYTAQSVKDIIASKDKAIADRDAIIVEEKAKVSEYMDVLKAGMIVADKALDKVEEKARRR